MARGRKTRPRRQTNRGMWKRFVVEPLPWEPRISQPAVPLADVAAGSRGPLLSEPVTAGNWKQLTVSPSTLRARWKGKNAASAAHAALVAEDPRGQLQQRPLEVPPSGMSGPRQPANLMESEGVCRGTRLSLAVQTPPRHDDPGLRRPASPSRAGLPSGECVVRRNDFVR